MTEEEDRPSEDEEIVDTWSEIKEIIEESDEPDWPQIRTWIQMLPNLERAKMLVDTSVITKEMIKEQVELTEHYKNPEVMNQIIKEQIERSEKLNQNL